ncbi:ABC transporter permease [candidate division WOR-3 bacterium]|uniref:ABC transporter permease n=1 Tax=candidate division WOR-3 bacterium TaxID=2052148 RepID=A0A938BNT8_UNCW3|nr:ABC transporter permease [candidate division WOR-3 bacterium]
MKRGSSARRFGTALALTGQELARNRVALLMLFIIPALFDTLVVLTTRTTKIAFKLASIPGNPFVQVSERSTNLIFIGTAAVGLLTAFLALGLVQKNVETNRRLVLCGYRPLELIAAKLAVLLIVTIIIGAFVAELLPLFFEPERLVLVIAGFALAGFVYGCYGLLIGAIFRRELEGVLFIALLANIDAAWLQNPVYYAGAQNQVIIRRLPAFYPSQLSMTAAFTHHGVGQALLGSLLYGGAFLAAALVVYFLRMRVRRPGPRRADVPSTPS